VVVVVNNFQRSINIHTIKHQELWGGKIPQITSLRFVPLVTIHCIQSPIECSHSQLIDSLALIFVDNKKAQDTCFQLAINVRNAQILSQEKGLGPNHIINIGTSLRKFFKPLITNRARELKLSQESYLRMLIFNDITKRFGITVSLTEENHLMSQIKKEKSNTLIKRDEQ